MVFLLHGYISDKKSEYYQEIGVSFVCSFSAAGLMGRNLQVRTHEEKENVTFFFSAPTVCVIRIL